MSDPQLDKRLERYLDDRESDEADGFTLRALYELHKNLAANLSAIEARNVARDQEFAKHEKSMVAEFVRVDRDIADHERRLKTLEKDFPEMEKDVSQSGEHRVTVERLQAAFLQMQAEDKARTEATIAEAKVAAAAKLAEKEIELQKVAAALKEIKDRHEESTRFWSRHGLTLALSILVTAFGSLLIYYLTRPPAPTPPPALTAPAPH